jgi:hypothetical protein
MTRHQLIIEELSTCNPEAVLWDGFDTAIIGWGQRCGQAAIAIYSYEKMVEILINRDKMSYEDAVEYIEVNVTGGWLGEGTPIALRS